MNGYVLTVIGTVLLSSVLTAIVHDGKTSAVIKGVARLACVLVIVAPVLRFFTSGNLSENAENSTGFFSQIGIEADEGFIQYVSEMRVLETERAVEAELSEKYGVETEVTIFWERESSVYADLYESESICVKKMLVQCKTKITETVKESMQKYLTKSYCGEVLIE